ncbi:MAG: PKD domain-containing protein [Burkholderiaceae bacterium]|nr:PKD domain-containing protein [Burkholderiaceae bacterium]
MPLPNRRPGLRLVAAAAIAALALPALAQPAPRAKPPFPRVELPQARSEGARAIELLGDRLPAVAAWYGRTPDQFRALLLLDRRLKLDRQGRLFVQEELDEPLAADATAQGSEAVLAGTLAPLEQTFALHSRPGAKRTIYLNFQGAQLSGTAWNGSGGTLTALPFDLDGVPYSFSTTELQRIQLIWQRVAEDYASMDVDVTTEAPPADAITRSGSSDDRFGTVALITKRAGIYDCSCGGVAYVGAFDSTSDYYKPALVFYDALGSGHEKYVAEAISHEVGHNGGLLHDGYSGGAYYGGHGSGATGWAPIMGVGYSKSLVQWSRGEYTTATNVQDDYAVMDTHGLPARADDHGGSASSATTIAGTASAGVLSLAAQGVIERPGDVDLFTFSAGAGSASFAAGPSARSPNLDIAIELRDAAGVVLASANPADALAASLTATLPAAGTYYLALRGTGKGDPTVDGYSDYGSTGLYAISGEVSAAAGQPPVASIEVASTHGTVPLTVAFDGSASSDPDGTIVAWDWSFGDGATASGATATHTYDSAGSFTAQLRVTDDSGMSATRATTITVDPIVAELPMRVADIGIASKALKNGRATATASVTILGGDGRAVPGATVAGSWSGLVKGSASATTGSTGVATLTSPQIRSKSGTVTFSVTGVTLDGYTYRADLNTETSDSITR